MELLITSLMDAIKYHPVKKTYAIRISSEFTIDHLYDLIESDNWVSIASYVFDDVWPGMPGGLRSRDVVFNEDLAQSILTDFKEYLPQTEILLVQCQRGMNRSPAIGIALNEIFGLGYDSDSLKEKYPEYRPFVYDTLLKVGKNLGL